MSEIEVCPVCGNDDFEVWDDIPGEPYLLDCPRCGWLGDTRQLMKKNPQPKGGE